MRVSIIGSGYVDIFVGICLAILDNKVTVVDTDEEKMEAMNSDKPPIFEEGSNEILEEVSLEATFDYQRIMDSELVFICVGTG